MTKSEFELGEIFKKSMLMSFLEFFLGLYTSDSAVVEACMVQRSTKRCSGRVCLLHAWYRLLHPPLFDLAVDHLPNSQNYGSDLHVIPTELDHYQYHPRCLLVQVLPQIDENRGTSRKRSLNFLQFPF